MYNSEGKLFIANAFKTQKLFLFKSVLGNRDKGEFSKNGHNFRWFVSNGQYGDRFTAQEINTELKGKKRQNPEAVTNTKLVWLHLSKWIGTELRKEYKN